MAHLSSSRHVLGLTMVTRVSVLWLAYDQPIVTDVLWVNPAASSTTLRHLLLARWNFCPVIPGKCPRMDARSFPPWLLRNCSPIHLDLMKQELVELSNAS